MKIPLNFPRDDPRRDGALGLPWNFDPLADGEYRLFMGLLLNFINFYLYYLDLPGLTQYY